MKKYFNNKQIALTVILLVTLMLTSVFSMSFGAKAIVYADSVVAENSEDIYYSASGGARSVTESFTYATKTVESYMINSSFPSYYNTDTSLLNTCANVAGANIIGYYDRYLENLIPGITPGIGNSTRYIYYPMSKNYAGFQAIINDLYVRMQTNVTGEGNTQTEYKNGLSSYVQSKGFTNTYSSVMTNGMFDLDKAKVQLKNGNPISLYMSGYNFTEISDNGNSVVLTKNLYDGNHIAIAYGYEMVSYYDAAGKFLRTEIYLDVATGLYGITGVYVINKYGNLNDAEAVHIG